MNRIWHKYYASSTPFEINPDIHQSVIELLDETIEKFKDRPAFSNMGKTLSFGEVDHLSKNFANYLKEVGLRKGDRIAIMMPNLLQYPIALYGAIRAGLIVVNTNPLYTPREMKHQFADSGVKAIVIAENYAANLQSIIIDTNIREVIITGLGDMLGFPKKHIVNFVVKNIKKLVPTYNLPKFTTFQQALTIGDKERFYPLMMDQDDILMIQYTGGTTGVAKGAMLTHRNIIANMMQIRAFCLDGHVSFEEGKELALCPLPLYHIFAFTVHCLSLFSRGFHNVLVTNPRDQKSLAKEINAYPVSIITGVNTLFNAMVNNPIFKTCNFSHLKASIGGGMAVQRPVAEAWINMTGSTLTEGYGLTESSPVLTVNPLDGSAGRLGMIGVPVPSTDLKIVDEQGNELPIGEAGELIAKGPQIMIGYYNKPDETAKTIKNGWLYTGDIAIMEADGLFKIVDRKKDMICVSGFNVYPNEIEEIAVSHPKVLEAAAVGVADAHSTEIVKLYVVKSDPTLVEEELKDFMKKNLTGYKVPKLIEFRDELPKTNVGKILRRELRDS